MLTVTGRVKRVMSDDDGTVHKTIIGIAPRDGDPPFMGSVATMAGAMQGCFAAFTFTDAVEAAKWPQGELVTLTLGE